MNFNDLIQNLSGNFIPTVVIACLVLGYILKQWIKDLDNKYIPTILAIVGLVLGCVITGEVSVESCVYGALSGLSSTGLHQMFKQYIENNKNE